MSRARIKVNGVVGSNTDLPINTLVQLDNDNDGTEQTYLWTLVAQPAGPSDGLSSGTITNPTITPKKEGSYRVTLIVDQGLVSEHSDSAIFSIRQIKTRTRIPATGETTEATDWGQAVAPILQMVDALKADPGIMVVELGAGSFSSGTLVRPAGFATLKAGLPGEENIPVVIPTDATTDAGVFCPLFLIIATVDGSGLATGKLAYVRKSGLVEGISTLGGASVGDEVFVSDGGTLVLIPGTNKRQVGRVLYINGGIAKIFFDGPSLEPGGAPLALGLILLFSQTSSDIGTYQTLFPVTTGSEVDATAVVNNGSGQVLIKAFATPVGVPNVTFIPPGLWEFDYYTYVSSNTGITDLVFKVYKRASGGAETLLFTVVGDHITETSVAAHTISFNNTSPTVLDPSDRIVVKVYAETTANPNITAHFVYDGSTHASHVHTPIKGGAIPLGGDLDGNTGDAIVIKIHGASVPIAGGLTTGNVLQVSGVSALSYGPLNLAGGSNFVTGVLPTGNQASQSIGGDGSGTTAALSVDKIKGHAVSASAPATNDLLQWSGSAWTPTAISSALPYLATEILFGGSVTSNGTTTPQRTSTRVVLTSRYGATAGALNRVVRFKVTLETTAGTAHVDLYNETDAENVTGATLTTTNTGPTELSATLTLGVAAGNLKDNKMYSVRIWITGGGVSDVATISHSRLEVTYE